MRHAAPLKTLDDTYRGLGVGRPAPSAYARPGDATRRCPEDAGHATVGPKIRPMEPTTRPANLRPNPARAPAPQPSRRLVLGIPSVGRREILTDTVRHVAQQTRLPDLLVISISQEADIDRATLVDMPFPITVVTGMRGLSAQRNRVLKHLKPADVLLFIDDDFLMAPEYLANIVTLFERNPEVVVATGKVIADGEAARGFDHARGAEFLGAGRVPEGVETLREIFSGHGCNMAIRARPVLKYGLAFDEALPLHSWLDDVDFSRQLAPFGRLVESDQLRGVHLGIGAGRPPGRRLGYSQVINPVHMWRKGTIAAGRALRLAGRNFFSNLLHSLLPRDRTDSRGQLGGNLRALGDILRGRIDPERARKY